MQHGLRLRRCRSELCRSDLRRSRPDMRCCSELRLRQQLRLQPWLRLPPSALLPSALPPALRLRRWTVQSWRLRLQQHLRLQRGALLRLRLLSWKHNLVGNSLQTPLRQPRHG